MLSAPQNGLRIIHLENSITVLLQLTLVVMVRFCQQHKLKWWNFKDMSVNIVKLKYTYTFLIING